MFTTPTPLRRLFGPVRPRWQRRGLPTSNDREPIGERFGLLVCRLSLVALLAIVSFGREVSGGELSPAEKGFRNLRTQHYLPPDFDEEVFAELWTTWGEPERTEAANATDAARRKLTFEYYGLIPAPGADRQPDYAQPALGYAPGEKGAWHMTCLACHGGQVAGQPMAGLPNSNISLQTLTEDVRAVKLRLKKPFGHLDYGSLQLPLSATNGTTNSVMFGVVLATFRRPDMSVDLKRTVPPLVHHDMDAPPFWNVKYKTSLYADGFAPKTARVIMQFMMIPRNSAETMQDWEPQFAEILAWIESLEAPKYPGPIDEPLAANGRMVFEEHCAKCHGTYGANGRYLQQTIDIRELGTDAVRLEALTPDFRRWMKEGWMSHYGEDQVIEEPAGYVAPPLHGIWASAPYLHNGSVPTLWHLLHPDKRPMVWKRTAAGYDQARVGLEVTEYPAVPDDVAEPRDRRRYFDTQLFGKSAAGHTFPDVLSPAEKQAVLEYLKTL